MAKLTAVAARTLVAKGKPSGHADGGNLYLRVTAPGVAKWTLRFMLAGRAREMGLGRFADVSLAEARDKAAAARADMAADRDPIAAREARRAAAKLAASHSFRDVALAYVANKSDGWKNPKHRAQWTSTLEAHAFPLIGDRPVGEVDLAAVIAVLAPIWRNVPETATRLRGRIEAILDAATVDGLRSGDNPARWQLLRHKFPNRAKLAPVQHHDALAWTAIAPFMVKLRERQGMAALALKFIILTACRSGEVRGATWREIDFDTATWTIPARRMKAAREHGVPLSGAAIDGLRAVRLDVPNPDALIFPGRSRTGCPAPLSDVAVTGAIRRLNEPTATVHGMRSTFRDWAGETTGYAREVIEHALAHGIRDKAEAAYARGDQFDKRRRLMADWGAHCDRTAPVTGEVVPLRVAG